MKTKFLQNKKSLLLLWFILTPYLLQAQTLRYTTQTQNEIHMLGILSKVVGNKPTESTTYVNAEYMRTDDGNETSTIIDLREGKLISLDHKKKTYIEFSFDEFMSALESGSEELSRDMEESGVSADSIEFDFSVTDLGESESVLGYEADRKLLRLDVKYTLEGTDDQGNTQTATGNLYTISDIWVSEDAAGQEIMKSFGENYAEKMGQSLSNNDRFTALQQAFQVDGRIGPAMSKMQEEMQNMQGIPLKSTVYVVAAPEGSELDVDAIINPPEQEKEKGGLGRLARSALRDRGIKIGGKKDEESTDASMPGQNVLVETVTQYTSFEEIADDPSLFIVPATYKMAEKPAYPGMQN